MHRFRFAPTLQPVSRHTLQVDVAYLYLYMVEGRGFDNWEQSVMEMAANPATTMWDQATATWNSPWTTPGGDIGPAGVAVMAGSGRIGTWLRFDVTASVQAMINGAPNKGFVITSNPNVLVEPLRLVMTPLRLCDRRVLGRQQGRLHAGDVPHVHRLIDDQNAYQGALLSACRSGRRL